MKHPKTLHQDVKIYSSPHKGECEFEYIEQIDSVSWFRYEYPHLEKLFFHVANESDAKPQYREKLSKMGITSGVADLVLLYPSNSYPYAVFEMKRRKGGRLSPDQIAHLNAAASVGAFAAVCCGFEEFKKAVFDYLWLD